MDINCTHSCFYQADGKCSLNELPMYSQGSFSSFDIDCPYYASPL